jgi:hypothetical protein
MWRAYAETPALGLIPLPRLDSEPACQRYTHSLSELAESLAALSGQPLTSITNSAPCGAPCVSAASTAHSLRPSGMTCAGWR